MLFYSNNSRNKIIVFFFLKAYQFWLNSNLQFFRENYAHLGTDKHYNTSQITLREESYSDFEFYASGRINVNWLLVQISLKKRHNLINYLTSVFFSPEKDKILYEGTFSPNKSFPFVFCICKKSKAKIYKKSYEELDFLTEGFYPSFISSNI